MRARSFNIVSVSAAFLGFLAFIAFSAHYAKSFSPVLSFHFYAEMMRFWLPYVFVAIAVALNDSLISAIFTAVLSMAIFAIGAYGFADYLFHPGVNDLISLITGLQQLLGYACITIAVVQFAWRKLRKKYR